MARADGSFAPISHGRDLATVSTSGRSAHARFGALVRLGNILQMVEIFHLAPGEQLPTLRDNETWVVVEASDNGRFFGTGYGLTPKGEDVFYISLAENDGSLDLAIVAATRWAEKRGVPRIWVQTTPD